MYKTLKPKVLHIVTDFPDGYNGSNTTHAVENLMKITQASIDHHVLSIVRETTLKVKIIEVSDHLTVVRIPRLKTALLNVPLMIFVRHKLKHKLKKIAASSYTAIHAHKLTIDGVLGLAISKKLKKPLYISVRGDTDSKWTQKDIFGRGIYRSILTKAQHIFWISQWARGPISKTLNIDLKNKHCSPLPNPCHTSFEQTSPTEGLTHNSKFIFVGKYDKQDKKGLIKTIRALAEVPDAGLDVYGSISTEGQKHLQGIIEELNLTDRVTFMGRVENKILRERLNSYIALTLPSTSETFGMSYIESLSMGLPVLGSQFSGISGYISKPYIKLIDENNPQQMAEALHFLINNNVALKANLRTDMNDGALSLFSDKAIANTYQTVVLEACLVE